MRTIQNLIRCSGSGLFLAAVVLFGCQSNQNKTSSDTSAAASKTPAVAAVPTADRATIRIKAGVTAPYTDPDGKIWLPDQGFTAGDGDTAERDADLPIANTKDQAMYRTERYGMTAFTYPVPNGKYNVKLHFAETYEGITGTGQRVFSFTVQGHEFKDFDIWAKAGGNQRAYIETVPVDITNGKLDITFTANLENPEINAIEIVPE